MPTIIFNTLLAVMFYKTDVFEELTTATALWYDATKEVMGFVGINVT